jgi:hypothetical protein
MRKNFPEIKKILSTKDIIPKIVCVLLSVILWAIISSTNIGEIKFKIPITFSNLPETLIASRISARFVTVTLSGKKDNLKNVNVKSIKAMVDLGQPEIGLNKSYPVEIVKEEIPENIDLHISIKDVNLVAERKILKKVKIKANIGDNVKSGYVLGRIQIFPESINISGPESLVRNIDIIQTDRIPIANKTIKIIRDVLIDTKDIPDITTDISKVRVTIPIIEAVNLSEYKKKIILKNTNERYKYILSQEEVSVYLQSDNPNIKPSADDLDIFVDLGTIDLVDFFKAGNENYIEKYFYVDAIIKKDGVKVISILPDVISIKTSEK